MANVAFVFETDEAGNELQDGEDFYTRAKLPVLGYDVQVETHDENGHVILDNGEPVMETQTKRTQPDGVSSRPLTAEEICHDANVFAARQQENGNYPYYGISIDGEIQ